MGKSQAQLVGIREKSLCLTALKSKDTIGKKEKKCKNLISFFKTPDFLIVNWQRSGGAPWKGPEKFDQMCFLL